MLDKLYIGQDSFGFNPISIVPMHLGYSFRSVEHINQIINSVNEFFFTDIELFPADWWFEPNQTVFNYGDIIQFHLSNQEGKTETELNWISLDYQWIQLHVNTDSNGIVDDKLNKNYMDTIFNVGFPHALHKKYIENTSSLTDVRSLYKNEFHATPRIIAVSPNLITTNPRLGTSYKQQNINRKTEYNLMDLYTRTRKIIDTIKQINDYDRIFVWYHDQNLMGIVFDDSIDDKGKSQIDSSLTSMFASWGYEEHSDNFQRSWSPKVTQIYQPEDPQALKQQIKDLQQENLELKRRLTDK